MNKNSQIYGGIIIIFILVVGIWIWFRTTVPTSGEITSAQKTIPSVNPNILKDPLVTTITSKDINGQIPLEVSNDNIGRDNPFADY